MGERAWDLELLDAAEIGPLEANGSDFVLLSFNNKCARDFPG
jgi:hypothetical protein